MRFEAFYMSDDASGTNDDDLRRRAEDALRHDERPGESLLDVADRLSEIGALDQAVLVAEKAQVVSTRKERSELGFARRLAVITSRKAARDARLRAANP